MPTVIPVLPSPDLDATADWWGRLGFDERARWPGYLILAGPHGVEIHFFAGTADAATNDHGGYVRFPSSVPVRRLFDQWAAIEGVHPPEPTAYGLLEGAVKDPDGNLLKFGGALDGAPTLSGICIDSTDDLSSSAAFWAAALSAPVVSEDDEYRTLADQPGGTTIEVQRLVSGDPRVHIDIAVDDVDRAAERFEDLGAERVDRVDDWWVMRAPTGHVFCLVPR